MEVKDPDHLMSLEVKFEENGLKDGKNPIADVNSLTSYNGDHLNNNEIKMNPPICSNFPTDVATSKMDDSFNSKLQIKVEQKEDEDLALASFISDPDQITFKLEIHEEIKLEQEEVIIKDEPEEVEEVGSLGVITYDTNPPTLGIRDRTANTEIKKEIKLEQEELIIKDEPEEMEELGSLEIIKYNTNPPTLGIRDREVNTEIKVDPSLSRVEELLKICTCDVQVIRLPAQVFTSKIERYLNFNFQVNLGQQFEEDDCTAQKMPTSDFEENFECKVCSLYVPLSLFKQHMLSHKDAKHKGGKHGRKHLKVHKRILFKCQQCDKAFNQNSYLNRHMLFHENKRLFKCQQCDKRFNQNGDLAKHMLFHENKRRFKCQQCDKSFNRNCDLKAHMLTHENKRRFKCQQCDKRFNQNGNLTKHMFFHENKRRFKCQQCDKSYNQNGNLTKHMLFHENKRRFKCQQCDESFNLNSILKAHILIHENKRPFNCQHCGKGFTRNGDLKRHMLIHGNKRLQVPTV